MGMVLTSLIALGSSPGKILPDQAQIERMARNLGMVYREEVLPIPDRPQAPPKKGKSLSRKGIYSGCYSAGKQFPANCFPAGGKA